MTDTQSLEVDRNYDFFQRNLSRYLQDHRGEYALLKDAAVVAWFNGPGDAYRAGLSMFADQPFSIQEARSEPIELGHLSFDPG